MENVIETLVLKNKKGKKIEVIVHSHQSSLDGIGLKVYSKGGGWGLSTVSVAEMIQYVTEHDFKLVSTDLINLNSIMGKL